MLFCKLYRGQPMTISDNSPVEELLWRVLGISQVVLGAHPNIGLMLSYEGGVYSR